jgi:hypothetical protein
MSGNDEEKLRLKHKSFKWPLSRRDAASPAAAGHDPHPQRN